jgi:hypothetical protein
MAPRAGPWLVDPVELNQMAGKRGIGWISMWRPLQPPSVNLIQIPSARLLLFFCFSNCFLLIILIYYYKKIQKSKKNYFNIFLIKKYS